MSIRSRPSLGKSWSEALIFSTLLLWGAPTGLADTLDYIDLQVIGKEIFAARSSGSTTSIRLEGREQITRLEARGRMGIALTDRRLLAVTQHSGWQERRLHASDGVPALVVSPNTAVAITRRRILGVAAAGGGIDAVRFKSGEAVIARGAGELASAVVTDRRVLAFVHTGFGRREIELRAGEDFEELRVRDAAITVRTSRRLLVLDPFFGTWRAERLPPKRRL